MNTSHNPNVPQLNIDPDILNGLLGVPAHQLAVMLPNLAKSHPDAISVLKTIVFKRFSGSQQIGLLNKLDGCAIEHAASQWLAHIEQKPLAVSIVNIAEQTAVAIQECTERHVLVDLELWRVCDARCGMHLE